MANIPIITDITYANLLSALSAGAIEDGMQYLITDRNILLTAIDNTTMNPVGVRKIFCPTTYKIKTDAHGNVWGGGWASTLTSAIGKLYIWGGLVWKSRTGNIGHSMDRYALDSVNWEVIPKRSFANHEYTEMTFGVNYDVANDWVNKQWDGKGNVFGLDKNSFNGVYGVVENIIDCCDWNWATTDKSFFNNTCHFVYNNNVNGAIYNNRNIGSIYSNRNGVGESCNIANNVNFLDITGTWHDDVLGELDDRISPPALTNVNAALDGDSIILKFDVAMQDPSALIALDGGILVAELLSGGTNYPHGLNTIHVTQSGGANGTLIVEANSSGVVTEIKSISVAGTGYVTADGLATTADTGAGCTVDIVTSVFSLKINGTADEVLTASLGDTDDIIILEQETPIVFEDVVTLSIIENRLKSSIGGKLAEVTAFVINSIPMIPTITTAITAQDGTVLPLVFDVDMANPAAYKTDFTLKVNTVTKTITSVALDSNTRIINVVPAVAFEYGDVIQISISDGNIKSSLNGMFAGTTDHAVVNGIIRRPLLLTAETNNTGTKTYLTFDMDMESPVDYLADFTVKINGSASSFTGAMLESENNAVIELTHTTAVVFGNIVTVSIAKGNILNTLDGVYQGVIDMAVNNRVPITPALVSAKTDANGHKVSLLFNTNILGSTIVAGDFKIKIDGNEDILTNVSLDDYERVINITQTNQFVYGDVITVSILAGNLKSSAGLSISAITNRAVTNMLP